MTVRQHLLNRRRRSRSRPSWFVLAIAVTLAAPSTAVAQNYTMCDNCLDHKNEQARRDRMAADMAEALRLAGRGASYFSAANFGMVNQAPYTLWFGAWDALDQFNMGQPRPLRQDVEDHVQAIERALHNWRFEFDCQDPLAQCSPGLIAYVVKANWDSTEPMFIQLCDIFWHSDSTGYDGSVNTILHEVGHLVRNETQLDNGANLNDFGPHDAAGIHARAQTMPETLQNNAYAHADFLTDDPNPAPPVKPCSFNPRRSGNGSGFISVFVLLIIAIKRRSRCGA